MHPYKNHRLIEGPDVADIRNEARKTSVGGKPRGYHKNKAAKAAKRRSLKRRDKRISQSLEP